MYLQGIYADMATKKVADLKVGDVIVWNFGYKSTVVSIARSKTGKTATLSLRSTSDGIVRDRKMHTNTDVAIE